MPAILIVEDEPGLRKSLAQSLAFDGHSTEQADSLVRASERLAQRDFDAVITDLNLVGESGIDLVKRLRTDGFDGLVVVITAYGSVETAVDAIRAGADEFIQKPLRLDELALIVARGLDNKRVRRQLALRERLSRVALDSSELIGDSEPWRRTLALAERFAALPVPSRADAGELPTILILGETGSGKGVLARHIHAKGSPSHPAEPPFVHVNCAALPASLIESELFGHEKGAFTDAKAARPGLFELAEHGTIFLDEIGEVPIEIQAKLLLVVERGVFRRIGGATERRVRARIVAATNQDLEARAAAGTFRADLLFRLNALTIRIPSLRERAGDALLIADAVLARAPRPADRPPFRFSLEARDAIRAHPWPGNTRELINAVRRASILCDESLIAPEHLGLRPSHAHPIAAAHNGAAEHHATNGHAHFTFDRGPVTFDSIERQLIIDAVRHAHGNVSHAAKLIGLNRGALRYRIDRLGLESLIRETVDR